MTRVIDRPDVKIKPSSPRPSLDRETAYLRIRKLIMSGTLKPDEALSERGLSVDLGVGRTPIREAIRALASDGLLDIVPTRGTFVRRMTLDDLREIFELRLALEGVAAFLVAERGTTSSLSDAVEALEQMSALEKLDVEASQYATWRFHDEMMRATRNQRLVQSYETLRAQSGLALQAVPHYDPDRMRRSIREHIHIYEAIVGGDPQEAQMRMWSHLKNAWQARVNFLTSMGSLSV